MDFSLSSSLVGSAVSNPDKLALDLQFAVDKTLTARKGPTPVFTRGSAGTFVGSNGLIQSAATNTPRFDHDPVTGVCKGLLMEEQRTNASWYSSALVVGTGWSANATPSVTSIVDGIGPDGNNAYEITEIANIGTHTLFNTGGSGTTGATSVVSGTTYTGSVFVKKVTGSVDWIQLSFSSAGFGSVQYANFNLSNGTIGNFSSSSPKIQDAGNGWYRCSITVVATTTTTTTSNLFIAFTNNTDTIIRLPSYAGNTANKILAAMVQFEAGSFPSSYIPTVAASAIRSADVCSITGSDFSKFYNPLEGSLLASSLRVSTNTNAFIAHYSDNSFNNGFDIRYNTTTQVASIMNVANSNQVPAMITTITAGSVVKQAFSYKLNDCGYSVNGAGAITDTSALIPTATRLVIGNAAVTGQSFYLNGTISSLRYYKKRLANAKLPTLTV